MSKTTNLGQPSSNLGDVPDLSTLLAECEQKYRRMTHGEWELWTGCSWRRIGLKGTLRTVISPTNDHHDGHPDLDGRQEDMDGAVTLVNAYPYLRDEIVRLHNLIDEAGKPWLALDPGVPWEGAIDAAMAAACREITRLRSLIARTVVVMDGSWDMLPPHEQDRLAEELRDAALTDAPAPPRTD